MATGPKKPRAGSGAKPPGAPRRSPAKRKAAPPDPEGSTEAEPVDKAIEGEVLDPEPEQFEEVDLDAPLPGPAVLARVKDRGIRRNDPLQSYMAEVTKHPLLSREEEHALAVRYRDTQDLSAAARLVASNLRLVVKLAHEYHRNPISLLDLVQEGNIGLMQAVKKYDPDRGVKLSSYAAWWIRAYILRYIMDNWKMVKLGTTEAQRKLFFKLRQEQERLISHGFEASPKLLAERLNVTEQDVVEMDQRLGHDEVSIDAPMGDDNRGTRGDRLLPSSSAARADDRLAAEELKAMVREKLAVFATTLEDKEKYIFEKRLTADEPLTLQDIGTHYGVSRERARQIEAALIGRMREYLKVQIPDAELWPHGGES